MEAHGFTPLKLLGKGSFGKVYLCEDKRKNLHCIKHIKMRMNPADPKYKDGAEQRQMVAREIYILINLKHPRIVRFKGSFQADNGVYILMEYLQLGNLNAMLAGRTKYFARETIATSLCDLVLGLEYLHLRHVIHRDIKPANILVGYDRRLKYADFGTAKMYTDLEHTVKQPGTQLDGTMLYMAPEAIKHFEFSFASDIWALGCVMYEMCTLQLAFKQHSTWEKLYDDTVNSELEPIPEKYSREIEQIIHTMLQPNPKERADMSWIVNRPIILKRYYDYYFEY